MIDVFNYKEIKSSVRKGKIKNRHKLLMLRLETLLTTHKTLWSSLARWNFLGGVINDMKVIVNCV